MDKTPKILKPTPKRPRSASRLPEMLALVGLAVGIYAVSRSTPNARRYRLRVREASALGRIVREQGAIRSDLVINKPAERRDRNYGYAFTWTDANPDIPKHRLIARSNDTGQNWREVADKHGYEVVRRPVLDELGPLTPPESHNERGSYFKIDCVEVRLLHHINCTLPAKTSSTILLYTERAPCPSCCVVIQKFLHEHESASLSLVYGHGYGWSEEDRREREHALLVQNEMEADFQGRLVFGTVEELHR
jgi:hypothetical protein